MIPEDRIAIALVVFAVVMFTIAIIHDTTHASSGRATITPATQETCRG